MEKELTEEEVDRFLLTNPSFVKSWLARRGLGDLVEILYSETDMRNQTAYTFIDYVEHLLFQKKNSPVGEVSLLTKNEMYKEILKILNSEHEVGNLCHKVLQNVCILLQCERASLFMARGTGKTQYLISFLFDVTTESVLEETLHTEENAIRIPFGKGISGFVAENKCLLNIKDVYQDPRFLDDVDKKTGFRTKSILCMPILDKDKNSVAVAQIMNKRNDKSFDTEDESIFESFLSFCHISMNNYILFQNSLKEHTSRKLLLKLNQCILKYQNCDRRSIREIIKLAMEMLHCESISIYLIDPENSITCPTETSKVFQLSKGASNVTEEIIGPKVKKAIEQNINSGNSLDVINLNDFAESRTIHFESEIESWLLCLSIKDACQNFVGWIMFVRDSMDVFSRNDINMMETFTMFYGLAIYNCRLYETAETMLSRLEFTNNILSYNTTCEPKIVDRFLDMEIQSSSFYQLYEFEFNDFLYSEDDTVLLGIRIFLEAKTLPILCIPIELLYRWILTVRKNYRPVTYHNWRHAINVTQTMFCMLTTGKLQIYFTEFEQICLLMASLCHDLDHRGYNNSFQVKTASPLATLYNTSILENHHLDRSIMILNNGDTNIFQNVSAEKYQYGLKLMEKAIIATDLVVYFGRRNIFKQKIEVDDKMLESPETIDLLISMMMTAADLSSITKPWEVQRKTAIKVAAEFFEQGDLEGRYKISVLPMMDRRKRYEIPKMQVGFIDFVSTTVYKLLSDVSDHLKPLYDGMLNNRTHWSDIANGTEKFDVDKEFELVLNNFAFDSVITDGSNIQSQELLLSSDQQKTVSTQTILTLYREQKNIQTNISIGTDMYQKEIVAVHTKPSIKAVERKTVDSQTEQEVSSVMVQTDRVFSRTSDYLAIVMPHEQATLRSKTSEGDGTVQEKRSLQRISQSSHVRPTVTMPTNPHLRRRSLFDEFAEGKRNDFLRKRSKHQDMGNLTEEKPQPIRRMTHAVFPSNPLRKSQRSSLEKYLQNSDSNSKQSNDDASRNSSEKSSSKYSSVDNSEEKDISDIENKKTIRRETTKFLQEPPTTALENSNFRKRKCLKVIPKNKHPGKGGFWKSSLCVIS